MTHMIGNTIFAFAVMLAAVLCGLGLLHSCGLGDFRQRILLAPSMALAISGIAVAIVVGLGIPVGKYSAVFWVLWGGFAVFGGSRLRAAWTDLNCHRHLWAGVLATMAVSTGFIWYGLLDYLGSPALDGWSYVSFGEYLRQYPKGMEGGLAPLYQYASHLSVTRYVASALLAVLIPPWTTGVDTQMTVGPLLILSIFSFSLSVAYAATVANQRGLEVPVWLAVLIGVVGGWVPLALHANNYDNLLALPFAPTLFAIALDRNLNRSGQTCLPAIFIAASIYIYPELSPLIVTAYGVAAAEDIFSIRFGYINRMHVLASLMKYAKVALLSLIIVGPYFNEAIRFFRSQLSTTNQMTGRPGEGIMPSLLDGTQVWGAMWGLGNAGLSILLGAVLTVILFVGARRAFKIRFFSSIVYLALMAALLVIMIRQKHYDYGAYKILLIGWWIVAIVVAAGLKEVWNISATVNQFAAWALRMKISLVLLLSAGLWLVQTNRWIQGYPYKIAVETREARDAVLKTQSMVQVTVADTALNAWLVYQLRDSNAAFTEFHGYMDQAHVRPLMARSARTRTEDIQYILTEVATFTTGEIIWQNAQLKLVKGTPERQPPQVFINAPNGAEILGGKPFFWLGKEPASVVLIASRKRTVHVEFEASVGPSVGAAMADYPRGQVLASGRPLLAFDTRNTRIYRVNVALSPGVNTLTFRHDYTGKTLPNSNGDSRLLVMGIKILAVNNDD
jgi:hypothetical protein